MQSAVEVSASHLNFSAVAYFKHRMMMIASVTFHPGLSTDQALGAL
jgi:hypothetical protein